MVGATSLRKGVKIAIDGIPYEVVDYQQVAMGRGRGHVRVRLRNLRNNSTIEKAWDSMTEFPEPDFVQKKMQYLYEANNELYFMDTQTYEQINFASNVLGNSKWFLIEGESYVVLFFEGDPINIDLPTSIILEVTYTEPGIKGDSVTNIMKEAILKNGLKIKVPLFVDVGDRVKIDTRTSEYLGRA